ncbi:GNAT family N-acetyltransferase [Streptomyces thermolineatus]|uniref:GNAT family N-acetyltransferase n=1 Tax=Streptomyces thermolineatus TaxID=44033 RepID=UPI00384B2041
MGMSVSISAATADDAERIFQLQYLCHQSEAELYGDYGLPPLVQTLGELRGELAAGQVLVARLGEEVVGSVRAAVDDAGTARIHGLVVHPRMQRHGLGGRLVTAIEERLAAVGARRYRLAAGHRSEHTLRLCRGLGYETVGTEEAGGRLRLVTLEKTVRAEPLAAASA